MNRELLKTKTWQGYEKFRGNSDERTWVYRVLTRMKKHRLCHTIIGGTVLILVWMPWLAYEFSHNLDGRDYRPMIVELQ